jgi:hypothetical protein
VSDPILAALQHLETSVVNKVGRQLEEFRLEMNGRFDAIEAHLDRLETEYHVIVAARGPSKSNSARSARTGPA